MQNLQRFRITSQPPPKNNSQSTDQENQGNLREPCPALLLSISLTAERERYRIQLETFSEADREWLLREMKVSI